MKSLLRAVVPVAARASAAGFRFGTPPSFRGPVKYRCRPAVLLAWALCLPSLAQQNDPTVVYPVLQPPPAEEALPGDEMPVLGSGGFLQFDDGSSNQSLRTFDLLFDGSPVGHLECANNVCGGELVVPNAAAAGIHTLTAEGGSTVRLTVGTPPPPPPPPAPLPSVTSKPFNPTVALLDVALAFGSRPAVLTETDVVKLGGAAPDALPYQFVTAIGTGSQIRLSSWQVGNQFSAQQNSLVLPGFDIALHRPDLAARIVVSAARRTDGNLWLTTWQVNALGGFTKLQTRGYGANEGVTVRRYGIAGRRLSNNTAQIVTSVVDQERRLRTVTWQVSSLGNIVGKHSAMIDDGLRIDEGAAPVVTWQRDADYVVNFRDQNQNLAWQYWRVDDSGVPSSQGETAQRFTISGTTPGTSSGGNALAALPLTREGQVIARLDAGNATSGSPLQFITYEHNRLPSADAQFGPPYLISVNTNDTSPQLPGVTLPLPSINTAAYGVADGLFEWAQGKGQGNILGQLAFAQPTPATGFGSVAKTMSAHLVLEVVRKGLISLDDCVTLTSAVINGLPALDLDNDGVAETAQSYGADLGRIGKLVGPTQTPTPLAPGDQVTLRTLLLMSMMLSDGLGTLEAAQYAARALFDPDGKLTFAQLVGTTNSQGLWVQEMQKVAQQLGMTQTRYCDPRGRCHSTPEDQIALWMEASLDPAFVDITTRTAFDSDAAAAERNACPVAGVLLDVSQGGGGYPGFQFNKIGNSAASYPGFAGSKGGGAGTDLNVGYQNGELRCNLASSTPRACQSCLSNTAIRLERPLFVAQSQAPNQSSRQTNAVRLLDYGYQRIFTPDHLADSGAQGGAVSDFAIASLDPVLNVSSGIASATQLRVCLWNVTANGINEQQCAQREFAGLTTGTGSPEPSALDLVDVTSVGADGDYVSAHTQDGQLRLDLWRVGALPE